MPFIIGTPIPEDKVLVQSISHIYGIGLSQSKILCKKAGFGSDSRGSHVTFLKGKNLENLAEATPLPLGADLRRFKNDKIRRLCVLSKLARVGQCFYQLVQPSEPHRPPRSHRVYPKARQQ